jgi:hypothetical protein
VSDSGRAPAERRAFPERLRALGRFWLEITREREPPLVLALLRVAVGLVLLGSLASVLGSGVLESMWIDVGHGGALHLASSSFWVNLLGGPTRSAIFTLFGIACVSGVFVTLGLGGWLPYLLAGQAYGALIRVNPDTVGAYDAMITNALYLLLFSAANATLSLDCRRKTGAWTSRAEAPAWPRYLLIFQLVILYGATGLQKMSHTWTPFGGYSALYWVLQDPTWRRFDTTFAASISPLLAIATAVTWHFEVFAPWLLLYYYAERTRERGGRFRRWFLRWDLRKPFAAAGVALHLGILVLLNVGPFSLISLAYYLALLRPSELERAFAWARARIDARSALRLSPPT